MLLLPLLALLAQTAASPLPQEPGLHRLTFVMENGEPMRYVISVPSEYRPGEPRPLVLSLHPGGGRGTPYYGAVFAEQIAGPALRDLRAIVVAPDCPTRAWTDPTAEGAVLALIQQVFDGYAIDRSRVLVTGFSLGGRGTWFMASRHPDLFTAAIPIAGAPGDSALDRLVKTPTYVIHSRVDDVVPFEPAEQAASELERLGGTVQFEALDSASHFGMGAYIAPLREAVEWVVEKWMNK